MSISKFQEKLFNKGCGSAILIGCAAVFGALAFTYFGKAGSFGGADPETRPSIPLATVDGTPVPSNLVEELIQREQQQRERQGGDLSAMPPADLAAQYGEVVSTLLGRAAVTSLAKSEGVQFSDDQLIEASKKQFLQLMEQQKIQAEMSGQLKPGASDADFDALLKARGGGSVASIQQQYVATLTADLKDPVKRAEVIGDSARPMLTDLIAGRIRPSDAELKSSYDQDTFKRILLKEKPAPSPAMSARLTQVQKDLASGTTFEQAMDRYSDDQPDPKKKISDKVQVYSVSQLDVEKSLSALKSLKVGSVSDPVKTPEGTSIYKLISVKNQAPADLTKNIAKYRLEFQQREAQARIDAQTEGLIASKTQWNSPGYKAIYDVTRPEHDPAKAQALFDEARTAVTKSQGYDLRPAQLAEYVAFDQLWSAPGADKVKLRPQRIQVLNDYLQNMENFSVRLELVGLYEDDHNGPGAVQSLVAAARSNNSYDQLGQSHFGDINARLLTLTKAGLINASEQQAVQDIQAQWKKDKAAFDDEQAKQRIAEAKARAEEEADRKKALAEQLKAQKAGTKVKIKDATSSPQQSGAVSPPSVNFVPGAAPLPPTGFSAPAPGTSAGSTGGKKG